MNFQKKMVKEKKMVKKLLWVRALQKQVKQSSGPCINHHVTLNVWLTSTPLIRKIVILSAITLISELLPCSSEKFILKHNNKGMRKLSKYCSRIAANFCSLEDFSFYPSISLGLPRLPVSCLPYLFYSQTIFSHPSFNLRKENHLVL